MNQRPPLRCTEAGAHFLDLNYCLDFRFLFAILLRGRGNGKQALTAPLPSRLSRAGSRLLINPFDTCGFPRAARNSSRLVERPALPPHYLRSVTFPSSFRKILCYLSKRGALLARIIWRDLNRSASAANPTNGGIKCLTPNVSLRSQR